jgi:hypothetical protein
MYLVVYVYDMLDHRSEPEVRQSALPAYGPFANLKAARKFYQELDKNGNATNMRVMKAL